MRKDLYVKFVVASPRERRHWRPGVQLQVARLPSIMSSCFLSCPSDRKLEKLKSKRLDLQHLYQEHSTRQ
ncbi:hypothetical protein PCANC_19892 [Puccinia coronata f. sp. avenae]|uniref:Uncharacterized protein n=1 Tax=Puccinia coronata f. sp. avenae TaxID=200324 RepID=A0A2N5TQ26_9BASI|nr:hypothetical protein PCANC_19892 [Puccinia coronata f. sp. avenae]PLW41049.1 hypothetical protein PCASD_07928 [Puccinia coronata f. sp. avenae]